MSTKEGTAVADMFRSDPVQSAIVCIVPLLLAVAQLANSYFTSMSMLASVLFATVVVLFTVLLTQYQCAQFRRQSVERDLR